MRTEDGDEMEPMGAATMSVVQFANYNQECADAALTTFIQYLGFILLIQALLIIMIDRSILISDRLIIVNTDL